MSEELAKLLAAELGRSGSELRAQPGYVTAWNPATGENTVSVGAAHYTNLGAIRSAVTGVGPCLLLFTPEPLIVGTTSSPTITPPV